MQYSAEGRQTKAPKTHLKGRHGKKILFNLTNRNVIIITLAVRLNTTIAPKVILNKTSRRNAVIQKEEEKNSHCESSQKWLGSNH